MRLTSAQKCLELWSTGEDDVRIAAFVAIRRLASSTDDSIVDLVLKVCETLTLTTPLDADQPYRALTWRSCVRASLRAPIDYHPLRS
jgi:hypothetical protein